MIALTAVSAGTPFPQAPIQLSDSVSVYLGPYSVATVISESAFESLSAQYNTHEISLRGRVMSVHTERMRDAFTNGSARWAWQPGDLVVEEDNNFLQLVYKDYGGRPQVATVTISFGGEAPRPYTFADAIERGIERVILRGPFRFHTHRVATVLEEYTNENGNCIHRIYMDQAKSQAVLAPIQLLSLGEMIERITLLFSHIKKDFAEKIAFLKRPLWTVGILDILFEPIGGTVLIWPSYDVEPGTKRNLGLKRLYMLTENKEVVSYYQGLKSSQEELDATAVSKVWWDTKTHFFCNINYRIEEGIGLRCQLLNAWINGRSAVLYRQTDQESYLLALSATAEKLISHIDNMAIFVQGSILSKSLGAIIANYLYNLDPRQLTFARGSDAFHHQGGERGPYQRPAPLPLV